MECDQSHRLVPVFSMNISDGCETRTNKLLHRTMLAMYLLRRFIFALVVLGALFPQQLRSQPPQDSPAEQSARESRTKRQQGNVNCTDNGTYVNARGQVVKRPEVCSSVPTGATAQCRDGTYSFSKSRRGTCSHHGGVAKWL